MFARRSRMNRRGVGFSQRTSSGPAVPLAGIWDGGFWSADDIEPQADDTPLTVWAPREGSVSWAEATLPPRYRTEYCAGDGKPSVQFVRASSHRMRADALGALANGDDQPLSIVVDAISEFSGASQVLVSFGRSAGTTIYHAVQLNSANNVTALRDGGTVQAGSHTVRAEEGWRQLIANVFDGQVATLYNDKTSTPRSLDEPAIVGIDRCGLGAWVRSTIGQFFGGRIRHVGITSQVLTAEQIASLYEYFYGPSKYINFLGDSITQGSGATASTGMRRPVWQRIASSNFRAEHCGTISTGTWAHPLHNGYSGRTISGIGQQMRDVAYPALAANGTSPDLVCLLAGTNNMGASNGAAFENPGTMDAYAGLLDSLVANTKASCRFAVSTIPPIDPALWPASDVHRQTFNAALPAIWDAFDAAHPGRELLRWDAAACLGGSYSATNFADDVHPNDTGYALMVDDPTNGLWQAIQPLIATW